MRIIFLILLFILANCISIPLVAASCSKPDRFFHIYPCFLLHITTKEARENERQACRYTDKRIKKFYVHEWFPVTTCSTDLPSCYILVKRKMQLWLEKFLRESTFTWMELRKISLDISIPACYPDLFKNLEKFGDASW